MNIQEISSKGIRLSLKVEGKEVGRARIYLIENDLDHDRPYALFEDLFVEEEARGFGYGSQLVNAAIDLAKKHGCYKIIGTSRHERKRVHQLYERFGFKDHGKEFRMDL
ncbi:GNAT family N-acetyltransferase [Candidatus Woesearchaeota archaeon CG10_big_fil_rev_8_21_14_0_10_45_16]|nr:MAG: GNAT family N-acetyltransferase [Candidatus Woesearchaeota archaeon CG10_big_fil_rev_8_21_14_0_10_45_16]